LTLYLYELVTIFLLSYFVGKRCSSIYPITSSIFGFSNRV